MANHNLPVLTSTYTNFVSELDARFDDLAVGLDPAVTTATNVPTNTLRWNSALNKDQKWNGSSWVDKSSTYVFPAVQVTTLSASGVGSIGGAAATLTAFTVNQSSTYAETVTNGSQTYSWRIDGASFKLSDRTAFTEKLEVSSTGLAVTGAISATGIMSGRSTNGMVLSATNAVDSDLNISIATNITQIANTAATGKIRTAIGGSTITDVSSTGLAVTGALSATGVVKAGTTATPSDGSVGVVINNVSGGGIQLTSNNSGGSVMRAITGGGLILSNFTGAVGSESYGADLATLDAAGNLGLGVTPSAWGAGIKAMQFGGYGTLAQSSAAFNIGNNYYNNGTNSLYVNSAHATLYQQLNGNHIWYTAPSGTAGNAIAFTQAMTLDASRNLLGKVTVFGQPDATGWALGASDGAFRSHHVTGTASGEMHAYFTYGGSGIGSITQNGTTGIAVNSSANLNLTGTTVTAPTPASNDSSTSVATTAFANPANSQATSGYVKLPSGVIIQWGQYALTASGTSISFPVAFPTACRSVVVTAQGASTPSVNNLGIVNIVSASQFAIYTTTAQTFNWVATGY